MIKLFMKFCGYCLYNNITSMDVYYNVIENGNT